MNTKEAMEKATSRPWERSSSNIVVPGRGIIAIFPVPQNGGTFDLQENIALTVAAVNSFEHSVKLAKAVIASHCPYNENKCCCPQRQHNIARDVLKSAGLDGEK